MVHEIYERSFARYRALASDTTIIGDCDNQIEVRVIGLGCG